MAADDENDAAIRARLEASAAERADAAPPALVGADLMAQDCEVGTHARCVTSAYYPTSGELLEGLDLSVEEIPGDPTRGERPVIELRLSGAQLRRADGGAILTDAAPLRLHLPHEALPALARALEHACLSAMRYRLFPPLRPTTALHAMLPLLTLDTVCSIAHELGTARVREAGDGARYALNAMLVAEVGAATPRDAVLEAVVRALGSWPGAKATG